MGWFDRRGKGYDDARWRQGRVGSRKARDGRSERLVERRGDDTTGLLPLQSRMGTSVLYRGGGAGGRAERLRVRSSER